MGILDWFKAKALIIAIVIGVSAFAGLFTYHMIVTGSLERSLKKANEDIAQLTQDKTALESENAQLTQTNIMCKEGVDAQNARYDELMQAERNRAERAEAAVATARKESKKYRDSAEYWRTRPQVNKDQCQALFDNINEYIRGRQNEIVQGS